jgi:antitoxin ParD1/3/4
MLKNTQLQRPMPKKEGPYMVLVTVHIPKPVLEALDELVRRGIVPNRSEAIRQAVSEYLAKYACFYKQLQEAQNGDLQEDAEDKAFQKLVLKGR